MSGYRVRVTIPRWLLVLLIASGLFAMHGITASTASAAAPCGVVAPHDQHGAASPAQSTGTVLVAPEQHGGHEGALCLAVLVGGLVVGLLRRRRSVFVPGAGVLHGSWAPSSIGRAPPSPELSWLCVSRT